MNHKIRLLILSILSALLFSAAISAQSVTVTGKEVKYTRKKPIVEFKKNFTINYPQIKGRTALLSRKIEAVINYERVFPNFRLREELGSIQWLEAADFEVIRNDSGILCISMTIQGTGAYPSSSTKYVVVDTTTGVRQTPASSFRDLAGLAAKSRKKQKAEIEAAILDIKANEDAEEKDPASLFSDSSFTIKDLNEFSVDAYGVVFHYNYGFPHVIQALQPEGEYSFTWDELKPFIKKGSLLSRVAP